MNDEAARARIAEAEPEAVLICAFGALIKEPLLSEHEMLNVHPSLLPRWRGAAPIERAIEAGDEETGVTIMRPTAELDAGPVCLQRAEPIAPDDDYGSLSARLAALGGELLVEALDLQPPFRDQPEEGVTYAEKIGPATGCSTRRARRRARAAGARAHAARRAPTCELPWGERLGVVRAALAPDGPPAEGALAERAAACCSARPPARSSCSRCIRREAAHGRAGWLRGNGARLRATG